MESLRVFCGYDKREAIGFYTFLQSLIDKTDMPLSITPIAGQQRDGTNSFTYSRFLVPEICGFSGHALFVDAADMLCLDSLAGLWELRDPKYAVQVVKHEYKTKAPVKYLGTEMQSANEDYERKNWSSVILWNCGHIAHFEAREKLRSAPGSFLHRFSWLKDDEIGDLPAEWNVLIGEQDPAGAKLAHFTLGIPGFSHYGNVDYSDDWKKTMQDVNNGMQYEITVRR